jgi:hypothetical protein
VTEQVAAAQLALRWVLILEAASALAAVLAVGQAAAVRKADVAAACSRAVPVAVEPVAGPRQNPTGPAGAAVAASRRRHVRSPAAPAAAAQVAALSSPAQSFVRQA